MDWDTPTDKATMDEHNAQEPEATEDLAEDNSAAGSEGEAEGGIDSKADAGAPASKPTIYQYNEYRAFLKDQFRWIQSNDPTFSQRKLARIAGFANPGFFNEVIQGRRRLSPAAVERMAVGLMLESNETEFLRVLVAFTEAKNLNEREAAQERLEQRRNRHFFRRLNQSQSKYYLDFNYSLVRAAIEACDFRGDYRVLGEFLRPPMAADSIKRYVRDLCEWGLVVQDRDGRYNVTHSYLEPPEEMKDALQRLKQAFLSQTVTNLNAYPADDSHISSALLTVSETTYQNILRHMEKVREELLRLVKEDEGRKVERVVLLNIQVLPRGGRKKFKV